MPTWQRLLENKGYWLFNRVMYLLLTALPFAFVSLFLRQKPSLLFRSALASFSVPALFIFPGAQYLFSPLFLLSLANTIHLRTFDRPLPFKSLKMIRHFSSLKSSIDKQIPLFLYPCFYHRLYLLYHFS